MIDSFCGEWQFSMDGSGNIGVRYPDIVAPSAIHIHIKSDTRHPTILP